MRLYPGQAKYVLQVRRDKPAPRPLGRERMKGFQPAFRAAVSIEAARCVRDGLQLLLCDLSHPPLNARSLERCW
jgi:hypothetical protein